MKPKAQKQGRDWAWLDADHEARKVARDQTTGKLRRKGTVTLRPGNWYQVKKKGSGRRLFWDQQGRPVGDTPKSQKKVVDSKLNYPEPDQGTSP